MDLLFEDYSYPFDVSYEEMRNESISMNDESTRTAFGRAE